MPQKCWWNEKNKPSQFINLNIYFNYLEASCYVHDLYDHWHLEQFPSISLELNGQF
jgi:hypothetical protein